MRKKALSVVILISTSAGLLLFNNCGNFRSAPAKSDNGSYAYCSPTTQAATKLFRLSNYEYQSIASDLLGRPINASLFVRWTPIAQVYGFDTMSEARIDAQGLEERISTAIGLSEIAVTVPDIMNACGPARDWANCGQPVVNAFAGRAIRRPLRDDESADFQSLFNESKAAADAAGLANSGVEALKVVLQAILVSPELIFKPEFVPGGFTPAEEAFAKASRLAFYFRGSFADPALWADAAGGTLTNQRLVDHANRLMDASGDRFTANFGGQWLDFRDSLSATTGLPSSMAQEAFGVFQRVLTTDLGPRKLLSPGFTVVDQPLASYYGLSYPSGATGAQPVTTNDRGGLFAQGLFLTRTATGSEMSRPIHRGIWALSRLLCRQLPRLDQATLEEIQMSRKNIDPSLPLSQQSALHRATASRCYACHSQMDPIGLALENYDKTGLWRTKYDNGAPITSDFPFNGIPVRNPAELSSMIQSSTEYDRCVATKLLTFAMYRPPSLEETCLPDAIRGTGASLKEMSIQAVLRSLDVKEGL